MENHSETIKYKISPSRDHLIILGILTLAALILWILGVEARSPRTPPSLLFVLGILSFLMMCRSYVFTDHGISMRLLGIPFRTIRWSEVVQLACIPNPQARSNSADRTLLMIVKAPGPAFDPQKDRISDFIRRNRGRVYRIPLYGVYEKTCVPDLEGLYPIKILVVREEPGVPRLRFR